MNYQTKSMIVNALTKIVDDAPTKFVAQNAAYAQTYGVTKDNFNIWINYIFSVMKIISSYVDVSGCLLNINSVINQPDSTSDYSLKVNSICKIILEFARGILYL